MTIYVQLLNEDTKVYRPVPAVEIGNNIYQLEGYELHDPEDETWEFMPGSYVIVEERQSILVAVTQY